MNRTNREWTPAGVSAAENAIRSAMREDAAMSDDTLAGLLDTLERDGSCELSSWLTASKRPEVVTADDSWFQPVPADF